MKRSGFICILAMALAALAVMPAFSQEAKEKAAEAVSPAPAVEAPAAAPAAPEAAQSKDVSIYGEVLATNSTANTMTVQYYDYDSDEEKTVELGIAGDTKLENAATLNDVKKGDWVDATYGSVNGKSVAKSVMVEKEEAVSTETAAPAQEPAAPAKQ
jgi:hypothetical protein